MTTQTYSPLPTSSPTATARSHVEGQANARMLEYSVPTPFARTGRETGQVDPVSACGGFRALLPAANGKSPLVVIPVGFASRAFVYWPPLAEASFEKLSGSSTTGTGVCELPTSGDSSMLSVVALGRYAQNANAAVGHRQQPVAGGFALAQAQADRLSAAARTAFRASPGWDDVAED